MNSKEEKFHTKCLLYGAALGVVIGAASLEISSIAPAWKNAISGGAVGIVGGGMVGGAFGHGVRLTRNFYNSCRGRDAPSADQTDKPDVGP